jgi:hypothetical protein
VNPQDFVTGLAGLQLALFDQVFDEQDADAEVGSGLLLVQERRDWGWSCVFHSFWGWGCYWDGAVVTAAVITGFALRGSN